MEAVLREESSQDSLPLRNVLGLCYLGVHSASPSNHPDPEARAEDITMPQPVPLSQSIGSSSDRMGSSSLYYVPSSRAVNTDKTWLLQTPQRTD
jgi:hypothetical protein